VFTVRGEHPDARRPAHADYAGAAVVVALIFVGFVVANLVATRR